MSHSTLHRPSTKVIPPPFTNPPPLAFDGGDSNFYRYIRDDPTNATDPSGLKPDEEVPKLNIEFQPIYTFNPPEDSKAKNTGAFIWPISWVLSKQSATGGYVIQHVKITLKGDKPKNWPGDAELDYYEAWQFDANNNRTEELGMPAADIKQLKDEGIDVSR